MQKRRKAWGWLGGFWGLLAFASTGAAGCIGNIGDGDGPALEGGEGVDEQGVLGAPDLRRLAPREVTETTSDLLREFGIDATPDELLLAAPDVRHDFSTTARSGNFTADQLLNIMAWSESVSTVFAEQIDIVLSCELTVAWNECASDFSQRLARIAFRRAIDDEDRDAFEAVYEDVTLQTDEPLEGFRAVIEYVFQNPSFWYLSNETRPDSSQLTSHAMAGRLSYFLWGTMPDAALREAADADALSTPAQIRAQAERLLDDPRAEAVISRFHREWLHASPASELAKDTDLFPEFDDALAADMDEGFDRFVQRMVAEGNIEDLLAGNRSAVNQRLESVYGLSSEASGPDDWVWRDLGPERAGILTHPLVLANKAGRGESALIQRGAAVVEDYFCTTLEFDDAVLVEAVDIPEDATSGKLAGVENRASKPACAACHGTLDPIGVSFEVFDAIGGFRTAYPDGVSIEQAGIVRQGVMVSEDVSYEDPADLMKQLAARPDVQRCYASKWVEWSSGHRPTAAQRAEVERLSQLGTTSIRTLLLELAVSPLLTTRGGLD